MKILSLLIILSLVSILSVTAQDESSDYDFNTFEAFMAVIDDIATERDPEAAMTQLDALWDYLESSGQIPFTAPEANNIYFDERQPVAFMFRSGLVNHVEWRGDFNLWQGAADQRGVRINNTDLWLMVTRLPVDARLDYKVVINGSTWQLDPANDNRQMSGFGDNSTLIMPEYLPSQYAVDLLPDVTRGALNPPHRIESEALGYELVYRVYVPAVLPRGGTIPVIYVTDGQEYSNDDMGNMVMILDNMIGTGVIEPVMAVFIDARNPDSTGINRREQEFVENADYAMFIAEELTADVESRYPIAGTTRDDRLIMGTSLGGVNALYMATQYSDHFASIGMQSPALWILGNSPDYLDWSPDETMRFYITNGLPLWDSYNAPFFVEWLAENKIEHGYIEISEGHSWGNWRHTLDDLLLFFFGRETS